MTTLTLAALTALHRDRLPTTARIALLDALDVEATVDGAAIRDLLRTPAVVATYAAIDAIGALSLADAQRTWESLPEGQTDEVWGEDGELRIVIYLECGDDATADECYALRADDDDLEGCQWTNADWSAYSPGALRAHLAAIGQRWLDRQEREQEIEVEFTDGEWDEEWIADLRLGEIEDVSERTISIRRQVMPAAGSAAATESQVIAALVRAGFARTQIASVTVG